MEPKRTLHSSKGHLKPFTKEEIAWVEEHFIDFAREQYLVR